MAKVATVAVVGRTNAGKSTLVNALVGEKVSIVSPVEQTTRNTIRGIVADPRGQLVLLDTPGLHKAVGTLGTLLNRMARRSAAGTDITCVVFDASQEPQLEDIGWMQRVAKEKPEKVVFVLNKADKSPFFEKMFRDAWQEASAPSTSGSAAQAPSTSPASPGAGTSAEGAQAPISPVWVKSISTTEGGAKPVLDALFGFAEEGEPSGGPGANNFLVLQHGGGQEGVQVLFHLPGVVGKVGSGELFSPYLQKEWQAHFSSLSMPLTRR